MSKKIKNPNEKTISTKRTRHVKFTKKQLASEDEFPENTPEKSIQSIKKLILESRAYNKVIDDIKDVSHSPEMTNSEKLKNIELLLKELRSRLSTI